MLTELITSSFFIAIVAYVWITVMVAPGQIFFPLKEFAYKYMHTKIFHLLFECFYCFGGQLAFWYNVVNAKSMEEIIIAPFLTIFILLGINKFIND